MSNNTYTPVDKTEDSVTNDTSKDNLLSKSEDKDFLEQEAFNNDDLFETSATTKSSQFIDLNDKQASKMSMIPKWLWLILALIVVATLLRTFLFKSTPSIVKSIGLTNIPTAIQGTPTPLVMPPVPNGNPSPIPNIVTSKAVASKNIDMPAKVVISTPNTPPNSSLKMPEVMPVPTVVATPVPVVTNTTSATLMPVKKVNPVINPTITNTTVCDANSLSAEVQFLTASSTLTVSSIKSLNTMAKTLKQCPTLNIEIAGHTDSAGHAERHLGLSQRRADSVVNVLVKAGVLSQRLVAKGYGSTKPIADNTTEEGRFKNRRVEFNIR